MRCVDTTHNPRGHAVKKVALQHDIVRYLYLPAYLPGNAELKKQVEELEKKNETLKKENGMLQELNALLKGKS